MSRIYSADWVLPVDGAPLRHGGIAVDGELIAAVGAADELAGEREHFDGCVIIPGLVNAHTHLEYAAYAGFGDGLPFDAWLGVHVARKRRLDLEDMLAIARLGAAECLASGVTTVADASFSGAAAPAADELGLRAIVHLEVFGGADALDTRFEPMRERVASSLSDRVRLGVSPHAPYTASLELYAACHGLGLPVATHLAESVAEREWLLRGTGPFDAFRDLLVPPPGETGIRMLAGDGLLTGTAAVHCVDVDDEEIGLLAEHGAAVVHCPRSNALLGCGVAPLSALLDAGVAVGLGTDSPASTPSFDMFDEMRAALLAARAAAGDPAALSAAAVLELATLGSARALGLDAEIGSLTPGKRADLCVLSLAESPFHPVEDPAVAVVLGGTATGVSRTIVGGATRYVRGGSGWHELRQNAVAARARMLEGSSPQSSSR